MTQLDRLQIENQLLREYRQWYNPVAISDEDLQNNITTQKELVKILEESYKDKDDDDSAKALITEVMKMVIWEDILENRDPFKLKLDL